MSSEEFELKWIGYWFFQRKKALFGCIVRLCRVKYASFFFIAEKRSLPLTFQNDEYEVREAAGTMDPLTPNRVAFPGLAGLACRS